MANLLILGIFLALAGGIANNLGALCQKYAINKIPKEEKEAGFFKKLLKTPLWLLGLFLIIAASGVLQMAAQWYIGGALIPGLLAIGMIVLTIGAVKILGEKMRLMEYLGIALMIGGVLMIGLSSLEITSDDMTNLIDRYFLIRYGIFTGILLIFWLVSRQIGKRIDNRSWKTVFLTFGSSFPYAIANAWLQPMIFTATELFTGNASVFNIVFFILSLGLLGVINVFGMAHLQDAFKHGDASKVYPIGNIPQQIAPIVLYYGIYLKTSPLPYSLYLLIAGVIIILIAGFLLGAKQGELETMDLTTPTDNLENSKKTNNSEL